MKRFVMIAMLVGVIGIAGAKFYLHHQVTSSLDRAILLMKPFADISYEGVSSTLSGELSVEGFSARVGDFTDSVQIDKISILTPGFWFLLNLGDMDQQSAGSNASIPESFGIAVEGLRANVSDDFMRTFVEATRQAAPAMVEDDAIGQCVGKYGYSVAALKRLGYDEIVMSMSMGYQRENGRLLIDVWAAIVDMYAMQIDLTLDGNMTVESIARTRKMCRSESFTDDQLIAAELDTFRSAGVQSGVVFGESMLESYEELLTAGSIFIIEANPPGPINLSQIDLYKPTDVPALLNLTAHVQ